MRNLSINVNKHLENVEELNAAEHGAYMFSMLYYSQFQSLPNEANELQRIMKTDDENCIRKVLSLYSMQNGKYRHVIIDAEIRRADEKSHQNSVKGKKGASARWDKKDKKNSTVNNHSQKVVYDHSSATRISDNGVINQELSGHGYNLDVDNSKKRTKCKKNNVVISCSQKNLTYNDINISNNNINNNYNSFSCEEVPYEEMLDIWNKYCVPAGLLPAKRIGVKRKQNLAARFMDECNGSIEIWTEFCQKLTTSEYHTGKTKYKFKATLDFMIECPEKDPDRFMKILENFEKPVMKDVVASKCKKYQVNEIDSVEWKQVCNDFIDEKGERTYDSWISPLEVVNVGSNAIKLKTRNDFTKEWIESNYVRDLKRLANKDIVIMTSQ